MDYFLKCYYFSFYGAIFLALNIGNRLEIIAELFDFPNVSEVPKNSKKIMFLKKNMIFRFYFEFIGTSETFGKSNNSEMFSSLLPIFRAKKEKICSKNEKVIFKKITQKKHRKLQKFPKIVRCKNVLEFDFI